MHRSSDVSNHCWSVSLLHVNFIFIRMAQRFVDYCAVVHLKSRVWSLTVYSNKITRNLSFCCRGLWYVDHKCSLWNNYSTNEWLDMLNTSSDDVMDSWLCLSHAFSNIRLFIIQPASQISIPISIWKVLDPPNQHPSPRLGHISSPRRSNNHPVRFSYDHQEGTPAVIKEPRGLRLDTFWLMWRRSLGDSVNERGRQSNGAPAGPSTGHPRLTYLSTFDDTMLLDVFAVSRRLSSLELSWLCRSFRGCVWSPLMLIFIQK